MSNLCQSVTCSFAYGVSKNIRFSDVNFINTWLTTPSIFLGSLPGFIYDQLIFTVKGQIWSSVIWRVHRKNPKNNIICLCCKFFVDKFVLCSKSNESRIQHIRNFVSIRSMVSINIKKLIICSYTFRRICFYFMRSI